MYTFKPILTRIIPKMPLKTMGVAGLLMIATVVLMAVFASLLTPYDPTKSVGLSLQPPSFNHPFGTNKIGQDMWSRTVYGARTMLLVVALSTIISIVIGVPLGLISGYIGGILDRILTMIMDAIYAFPSLILAIAIAAALGPGIINTAISIAIVYVPTYFRMVRGQTLNVKNQLYVEAAVAIGAKPITILARYILPNVISIVVAVFTLSVADVVLTEAGLSFFGLSVPAPTPDWGFDLRAGHPYLVSGYWWLVTFPGLMIIILAVGFTFLGESISEYLGLREVRA
ncbi:MAG: ABC transporter permease [Thaumarchaeota archaeon]|jgi:peptide/nickel transport system permease protein|nr:ABC transporter permease [Candidatus Geocrenenecus arthurdayi]MCL7388542.1 ABC transporter permease [Candidatus Geocrenenecus arthurdayi]MCL7391547.1 ABC transporter permease [Candidatus Geocrenenecus arthurdayi]MCL7396971.1 ABC transporter permease [Candidatus Geocrenenecus arthurdayi]MCL7403674.1 ABC transporter permease [Candidatus Geocrenenecus arthurdayi]